MFLLVRVDVGCRVPRYTIVPFSLKPKHMENSGIKSVEKYIEMRLFLPGCNRRHQDNYVFSIILVGEIPTFTSNDCWF